MSGHHIDFVALDRKPSPKASFLTSNSSMYRNQPLPLLGRFW
jgi:hypothetical protein